MYAGGIEYGKDGEPHSQVWAYSLETGTQLWSRRLPCPRTNGLALGGGWLVAVIDCGVPENDYMDRVAFVDPSSGAKGGCVELGTGSSSTITIYEGLAVIEDGQRELNVIDLSTRSFRNFAYFSDNYFGWAPLPVIDGEAWMTSLFARPAFSEGIVVALGDGAAAVRLDDGPRLRWAGCYDVPPSSPPASNYSMCARVIETGELLWSKPLETPSYPWIANYNSPVIVDGVVYSAGDGVVHAFDLKTGEPIWDTAVQVSTVLQLFDPLVQPIYASGVHFVPARDATGTRIVVGLDATSGDIVTRRPRTQLLGPAGGGFAAVVNGRLVSSAPNLRVTTFDRP